MKFAMFLASALYSALVCAAESPSESAVQDFGTVFGSLSNDRNVTITNLTASVLSNKPYIEYGFNVTRGTFQPAAKCFAEIENPDGWGFVSFEWMDCVAIPLRRSNSNKDDISSPDTVKFRWDQHTDGHAVLWVASNVSLNSVGGANTASLTPDVSPTPTDKPSTASPVFVLQTATHTIPASQFRNYDEYAGPEQVDVKVEDVQVCISGNVKRCNRTP
ncbi:hypothetical protein B0H63DRAFT_449437 [Podospora didyma]|uniref:Uncharacterized protein n=1 Tax=Podospora didyma TaxID=330526 RepID=A0AAE0NPZ6_9PEZI|nr:hypothetical protein B0H63DRAFT_449437 [Podospora didyma]